MSAATIMVRFENHSGGVITPNTVGRDRFFVNPGRYDLSITSLSGSPVRVLINEVEYPEFSQIEPGETAKREDFLLGENQGIILEAYEGRMQWGSFLVDALSSQSLAFVTYID